MTTFKYMGNGRFTYSFEGEVKKVTQGMEFAVMKEDEELFRTYNDLVIVEEPKLIKPKEKTKEKKSELSEDKEEEK